METNTDTAPQTQYAQVEGRMELTIPTVHTNGTSREDLLEVRRACYGKLGEALDALAAMSPNGRDYYMTPGAFERARAQQQRRFDTLASLRAEILCEFEALDA